MMGLVEEGDEVMKEREHKEGSGADLALIAAAQKDEIAGYTMARNLAQQLDVADIVQLLQLSLAGGKKRRAAA